MSEFTNLSQYSECVNSCPSCPISGKGEPEQIAVNAMCGMFGLYDRLAWGSPAAMQNTGEVVVTLAGGNPDNAEAVVAATHRILNTRQCPTSNWYKGV